MLSMKHLCYWLQQCGRLLMRMILSLEPLWAAESRALIVGLSEELNHAFLQEQAQVYPVKIANLSKNSDMLFNFLKKEGFYSASFKQEYFNEDLNVWQSLDENSSASLTSLVRLNVTLGEPTTIEKIDLRSLTPLKNVILQKELDELSEHYQEKIASYKNYFEFQDLVLKKFKDYGYLNAIFEKKSLQIYPESPDSTVTKASWHLMMNPKNPSFFGKVSYANAKVHTRYLHELEPFKYGDFLLTKSKEDFRKNLMQTGWFEDTRLLLTPNAQDAKLQDITVFCVPRTVFPLAVSGELTQTTGINAFIDLKFPIINQFGHQFELNLGWKNLYDCWKEQTIAPNSVLINYMIPRFCFPFYSQRFRFNSTLKKSVYKRKLYCLSYDHDRVNIAPVYILEDFLQIQAILNKIDNGLEVKGSLCKGRGDIQSSSFDESQARNASAFEGNWLSVSMGKAAIIKEKIGAWHENNFNRMICQFLSRNELEALLFAKKNNRQDQFLALAGLRVCGIFFFPNLNLKFKSLHCPIDLKCRFQTLLMNNLDQNFCKVHPQFRCFSGGETFLLGYDADSVAPIYPDGTYGGKNGIDLMANFGKFDVNFFNFLTHWSFFMCQTFFDVHPKWTKQSMGMHLGTLGVRVLISLSSLGKLGIYIGTNAPWGAVKEETSGFFLKKLFFRLRLEK